ncbi:MAG: hypothetical protein J7K87_02180, partial [Candidatus Aenigmarchaeota archaeon]|nr:hypothetical protein [Candidatus Aenigmarchaeota archaeon]
MKYTPILLALVLFIISFSIFSFLSSAQPVYAAGHGYVCTGLHGTSCPSSCVMYKNYCLYNYDGSKGEKIPGYFGTSIGCYFDTYESKDQITPNTKKTNYGGVNPNCVDFTCKNDGWHTDFSNYQYKSCGSGNKVCWRGECIEGNKVVLCMDSNFGGSCLGYPNTKDVPSLLKQFDNKISSIYVPNGCTITLYSKPKYGGKHVTLTGYKRITNLKKLKTNCVSHNCWLFGMFCDCDWNDVISSFKVNCGGTTTTTTTVTTTTTIKPTTTTLKPTTTTISPYCTDSDGGVNYYVKGTTTDIEGTASDYCEDGKTLVERYCSGKYQTIVKYNCPYGCSNGACIKSPTTTTTTTIPGNNNVLFDTGRGSGKHDKMTYWHYYSEIYFTPTCDMNVEYIKPDVYYCNGVCYYEVKVYDSQENLIGKGFNNGTIPSSLDGRLTNKIILKSGKKYTIYQHEWTTMSIGIYTAGGASPNIKDRGRYELIYAKSDTANHNDRGPVSFKIIGTCANQTSCHQGSLGSWDYCSSTCKCSVGEGDCDSNSECQSGLVCKQDVGAKYGWNKYMDVCEYPSTTTTTIPKNHPPKIT